MAAGTRLYTAEEFDSLAGLPENIERRLQLIGGEIVEVVSNNYASEVAARISYWLTHYLMQHPIGRITGADGGYQVSGERYIPDVAFISKARQPEPSFAAYNPQPPDLAVEVLSPTNDQALMRIKVTNYVVAGTTVWVVDPETKMVEIHAPGHPVKRLGIGGMIEGRDVLPGFSVAVRDIFPE